MLIFVDESGDLGYRFERSSSAFFTVGCVAFDSQQSAAACQAAIQTVRQRLNLPSAFRFHFAHDSHERRVALLREIARQEFWCSTFTLDKKAMVSRGLSFPAGKQGYVKACAEALADVAEYLDNAKITLDGSLEKSGRVTLERELRAAVRQMLNLQDQHRIREFIVRPSVNDPLLQLADYVVGVSNRLSEEGEGANEYAGFLRTKWRRRTVLP